MYQHAHGRDRKYFTRVNSKGFTLVELLMVVVLLGILSAVAASQFIDFGGEAREAVTRKRMSEIRTAIAGDPSLVANGQYLNPGFEGHLGHLPVDPNPSTPGDDLLELAVQGSYPDYDPFSKSGWRGPYLQTTDANWNQDGWGNPIRFDATTRTIRSCGPDGICGGAGASDDIVVNL